MTKFLKAAVIIVIVSFIGIIQRSETIDTKYSRGHNKSKSKNSQKLRYVRESRNHDNYRNKEIHQSSKKSISSSRVLYDHDLPLPHSIHELQQIAPRKLLENAELAPLYPGYGTHFAYIYVGTPSQRQSVIIDTGSRYTAFPCVGCSQCGQHTDAYFDIKNSSTSKVLDCKGNPCVISQSYSEGSSWRAIKVQDQVYIGAITTQYLPNAQAYSVPFEFGCQQHEEGLFRTQLADGIMGLAMAEDTLPYVLHANAITSTKVFSLCYRVGGGIMTIGGVDQRIHQKLGILYAKLLTKSGWYQLNLLDILLENQKHNGDVTTPTSLGADKSAWSSGKGCILDSGTTDTYLPSSISAKFVSLFKELSGITYTTANIALTNEQMSKIPNILFTFEGIDGQPFTIMMPWTSYVDNVGGGKYAFRIYLSEGQGVVLGANFMNGYNIIFDPDDSKIGFAKSLCKYEDHMILLTRSPTNSPVPAPGEATMPNNDGECISELIPITECNAYCDEEDGYITDRVETTNHVYYRSWGNQSWEDLCVPTNQLSGIKPCSVTCRDDRLSRGNLVCPENPWSRCDHGCMQYRDLPTDQCNATFQSYNRQTRTCYSSLCPYNDGDYVVYIDMRVGLDPRRWSYVYTEAFSLSLSKLLKVKDSAIELLNDASSEIVVEPKLHFQIRLKKKDYDTSEELNDAANTIIETIWEGSFPSDFIDTLNEISKKYDQLDHSRYGWLENEDIEVLNAVALPIGDDRDPFEVNENGNYVAVDASSVRNQADLLLIGVAIASLLVLCCVSCLHYRLRIEHARLEKDKGGGIMLTKLWSNGRKKGKFSSIFNWNGNNHQGKDYKPVHMTEVINDDELDDEEGIFDNNVN